MIRNGRKALSYAGSFFRRALGLGGLVLCVGASASSYAQSFPQNSPIETVKTHPLIMMEDISSRHQTSIIRKNNFLKIGFGNSGDFDQIKSILTQKFGAPSEEFPLESVWYIDIPNKGPNLAKYITAQLRYDNSGHLELVADGRLADQRGGPLIVGPANAMVRKSNRTRRINSRTNNVAIPNKSSGIAPNADKKPVF